MKIMKKEERYLWWKDKRLSGGKKSHAVDGAIDSSNVQVTRELGESSLVQPAEIKTISE